MKLKLISTFVLLFMFVVSACGSLGKSPQIESPRVEAPPAASGPTSQPEQLTAPTEPLAMITDEPVLTDSPPTDLPPTPIPVPTSRGPNLEATNPSTVALASGNLHLVEFFRFT